MARIKNMFVFVALLALILPAAVQAQLSAPTLSSPTNSYTGVSSTVTLAWSSVSGASSYNVQVSTSASFTTTYVSTTFSGTSYHVSGLSQQTQYYWSVSASS